MANLAPTSKVTIQTDQTREFSNVHNFVKNFVWDPIQSTYWSQSRGASFAPKKVRKRAKQKIKSQGVLRSTVDINLKSSLLCIGYYCIPHREKSPLVR